MRRNAGFTLIELMIVVAIIGVLASVAIPAFENYKLRSRTTERAMLMKTIQSAVSDLWIRDGKFPTEGGGVSSIACPRNPAGTPGPVKRYFASAAGDWQNLAMVIEGHVYYSYDVIGVASSAGRNHEIRAIGDLDADGATSDLLWRYEYEKDQVVDFVEALFGGKY